MLRRLWCWVVGHRWVAPVNPCKEDELLFDHQNHRVYVPASVRPAFVAALATGEATDTMAPVLLNGYGVIYLKDPAPRCRRCGKEVRDA